MWNMTQVGDMEDLGNMTVEDMEGGNRTVEDFQDFFTEEEGEEGDLFPDPDTSIDYTGETLGLEEVQVFYNSMTQFTACKLYLYLPSN